MTNSLTPALTPEEWRRGGIKGSQSSSGDDGWGVYLKGSNIFIVPGWSDAETPEVHLYTPEKLHALAALCLQALAIQQQPFGFTWEDVDALRSAKATEPYGPWADEEVPSETARLQSLADRIAAMLPPRMAADDMNS